MKHTTIALSDASDRWKTDAAPRLKLLQLRLTDVEMAQLKHAAQTEMRSLSSMARVLLLAAMAQHASLEEEPAQA